MTPPNTLGHRTFTRTARNLAALADQIGPLAPGDREHHARLRSDHNPWPDGRITAWHGPDGERHVHTVDR